MTPPLVFITGARAASAKRSPPATRKPAGARLASRRVGEIENWAQAQGLGPERCVAYAADVQQIDSIVGAGQRCIDEQGLPDVVIASAGISIGMDTESAATWT